MAGTRDTPSIADDWQEVDDNASVRSISTTAADTEDDFCVLPKATTTAAPPAESHSTNPSLKLAKAPTDEDLAFIEQKLYALNTSDHMPAPQKAATAESDDSGSFREYEATAPIPIESAKKDGKQPMSRPVYDPVRDSQRNEELSSRSSDAMFYQALLEKVSSLLDMCVERAQKAGTSNLTTVGLLVATCRELSMLVAELKPIQAAYTCCWVPNTSDRDSEDVPLNPDLLYWMDNVKNQLESLLGDIERLRAKKYDFDCVWPLADSDIPADLQASFAKSREVLDESLITIENFLPIIKADFNEYRTRAMTFPSYKAPGTKPEPPPSPSVSSIRSELYKLKDELQKMLYFLTNLQHEAPEKAIIEVPDALRSLRDLIEAVTTILTNDGSDWIEAGLPSSNARTISYHQFISLSPDVLSDICQHLQDIHEQVDVSDEPLFTGYSETMILNHKIVTLNEGGQMFNLLSIISLLDSMVMARL